MKNHNKNFFNKLIFVFYLIFAVTSFAQDSQYWNLQYGTRSNLLGGVVIGSVTDLGASYYNPGMLALVSEPSLIIGAKIQQLTRITVEDALKEGSDLTQSRIQPSPTLAAGSFRFKSMSDHLFAYSMFNRQDVNQEFVVRKGGQIDVIDDEPGLETFNGELGFTQNLNDLWLGFTWSYSPTDLTGIGITQFISIRDQSSSRRTTLQSLAASGKVSASIRIKDFEYRTYRTLTKIGLGFDLTPLTLGLTITTPSIQIAGSGNFLYNEMLTGIDTDNNGQDDDRLTSSLQNDIDANYQSSWAAGFGAAYNFKNFRIHLSTEWYAAVSNYRVLETRPFISQSSGAELVKEITQELSSVINYGIGVEYDFGGQLAVYASLITDYSAAIPYNSSDISVSTWYIFHLTAGSSFTLRRSEYTLGLTYSFGDHDINRPVNIDPDEPPYSQDDKANLKYMRLKFILAYSFSFGTDSSEDR
jgi:hypothetical protein